MRKIDVYELAIRILGIYFGFTAISDFVSYSLFYFPSELRFILHDLISILVKVVIAYVSVFRTHVILNQIFNKGTRESELLTIPLNKTDLLEVCLSVIAILLFVNAVPPFLDMVVQEIYYQDRGDLALTRSSSTDPGFYFLIFKVGIGILLIFNARNFSKKMVKIGLEDDATDSSRL